MTRAGLRAAARRILKAGLDAVEPGRLVRAHIRANARGVSLGGVRLKASQRLLMVSVGKAAVPMARAAHVVLGERIAAAIVIAPGRVPKMARTIGFTSGHPMPDAAGVQAGKAVLRLLETAGPSDVVLLLLSGGASALMPAPIPGVSLRDKQRVTRLLLRRGAAIAEINAVRKRLSRLKGGGFARLAAPARVVTLAISDVPGDDIGNIGSGPAVDDPRAASLARRTVRRFLRDQKVAPSVRRAIDQRRDGPGGALPARAVVIGSGRTFARAASEHAARLGFRTLILEDALRGEARKCGPDMVRRFAEWRCAQRLSCLIATGETVVAVSGHGHGGRNQEVALSAVSALARLDRPSILASLATDGRDGKSAASGGLVDDQTAARALKRGVSARAALDRNDSTAALRRLGGLIVTGATRTNVADVVIVLG